MSAVEQMLVAGQLGSTDNYPGETGLTNATVFGKLAAEHASQYLTA